MSEKEEKENTVNDECKIETLKSKLNELKEEGGFGPVMLWNFSIGIAYGIGCLIAVILFGVFFYIIQD